MFSASQLAFAAIVSLALYGVFVFTQTVHHRDFFLPTTPGGDVLTEDDHAAPPTMTATMTSLVVLVAALVAVVGLTKIESPAIEAGVAALGFPQSFVGVVIALLVLLPESIAAVKAASRNRLQTSLNLAYGSAMASIGLTIPTIAIASITHQRWPSVVSCAWRRLTPGSPVQSISGWMLRLVDGPPMSTLFAAS